MVPDSGQPMEQQDAPPPGGTGGGAWRNYGCTVTETLALFVNFPETAVMVIE